MQQGNMGEALTREVLTVEIREARDLLPADRMISCEPYVVISVYDSSGRPIGTRKTNVVAGSLNPYWMERFEFQVTQWDKEGGYVEVAAYDNRDSERLGYIRQPLFRISETGTMEGWHFMDRARNNSAALFFKMLIHPYRSLAGAGTGASGLASGVSARQAPAAAGIGLSGAGSRTPVGPTVYNSATDGFASPSGMPMEAAPATATPTIGAPGLTPAVGPAMARTPGTAPLFIMRQHFWGLANTYEVKDSQGLLLYRLIGSFGDKLDDIRIADSSGHEVGFIREETSLLSKVYRMPTYLISVYGTTAKLKKKFLTINEPIYSLRPFNAQSIHVKGNFSQTEFSYYQLDTIIADVSKGLATGGGQGLYGIRVAPTFSNPLLILAATVAIDRITDVAGLRPVAGVYNESKTTLMSRVKRRGKKPTVVTTTAAPVAATTTTTATPVSGATRVTTTVTPVATPVVSTGTTTTARSTVPLSAAASIVTPVATPIAATVATPLTSGATATSYAQPIGTTTSAPYAEYYDARGIPTTPVVSVTTVSSGGDREGLTGSGYGATSMAAGGETTAMMQPRAEMAARETLREEEQRMMQAERLNLASPSSSTPSGMTPPIFGYEGQQQQQQHQEKEKDQRVTESELRRGQPVQIPITGTAAFD